MAGPSIMVLTHSPASEAQAGLRAAALAALAAGQGVCLTGDNGSGKTAMLKMLLGAPELQHQGLRVVLQAEATPLDVASRIAAAKAEAGAAGPAQRLLLVAEDVDRLRRDTLLLLDGLAREGMGNALFLLTGRPSLLHRLVANGHSALVSAVPTLLLLRPLTPHQAAAQLEWLAGPARRPPGRRAGAAMLRRAGGNPARLAAAFASHAQRPGNTARPVALGVLAGLLMLGSVAGWVLSRPDPGSVGEPAAGGTSPGTAPSPAAEASPPAEGAVEPPVPPPHGLVLVARAGDTLPELYRRVYLGVVPPPYDAVVAANVLPVRTGRPLVFPTPPLGWHQR